MQLFSNTKSRGNVTLKCFRSILIELCIFMFQLENVIRLNFCFEIIKLITQKYDVYSRFKRIGDLQACREFLYLMNTIGIDISTTYREYCRNVGDSSSNHPTVFRYSVSVNRWNNNRIQLLVPLVTVLNIASEGKLYFQRYYNMLHYPHERRENVIDVRKVRLY